jgi:hypothetical protein
MLISPDARSDPQCGQGCPQMGIAELRGQLARPSQLDDGHRQRLLDLAQRVARVQGLGGEYRRVSLSETARAAINQDPAVV